MKQSMFKVRVYFRHAAVVINTLFTHRFLSSSLSVAPHESIAWGIFGLSMQFTYSAPIMSHYTHTQ